MNLYVAGLVAVTLTQLSAFLSVVRHGSVTAAAEELVVTQPSVSAAVAALERELGVQLTERAGRSVKPTPAGETYARYAADVLALLKEGSEVAAGVAEGAGSRLRISAVTTAGEYLLPPLLRAFREHHPELEVSVHVGNREEVFGRLEAHEADVAISGGRPRTAPSTGWRSWTTSSSSSPPPATRSRSAPGWRSTSSPGTPWLMREQGSGTRRLCEVYLDSHQLQPPLLTLGSNGAIKNAARMGLGIALQSREAVALELELGLLATISPRGGLPKRSWYVVRSTVGPSSQPAEAFTEFVRSSAAADALARMHGDEIKQSPPADAMNRLGVQHRVGAGDARRVAVVRVDAGADLGPGRDQVVEQQGLHQRQRAERCSSVPIVNSPSRWARRWLACCIRSQTASSSSAASSGSVSPGIRSSASCRAGPGSGRRRRGRAGARGRGGAGCRAGSRGRRGCSGSSLARWA